jgi:hypothetical protein
MAPLVDPAEVTRTDRWAPVRGHPFLAAYVVALVAVWSVTALTWDVRGGTLELSPLAQVLQYLLVGIAAALAALRLRVQAREAADAMFGFGELRWAVADDIGGRTFWLAMGVGVVAMVVNIALLVAADLLVAGGSEPGTYAAWLAGGIAAGGIVGMFGALLAAGVAVVMRIGRRG